MQLATKTPAQSAFIAPRPVPALRIVKRTNIDTNTAAQISKPLSSAPLANLPSATPSRMTPRRSMSTSSASASARPPLPIEPVPQATATSAPVRRPTLNGIRRPEPGAGAAPPPAGGNRPVGLGLKERLQGKKAQATPAPAPTVPSATKAPPALSVPKYNRQSVSGPQGISSTQIRPPQPQASKFGYTAGTAPTTAAPTSRIPSAGAGPVVSRLPPPAARKAIGRSSSGSLIPGASGVSKIGVRRV